jgi:hypothetical protein
MKRLTFALIALVLGLSLSGPANAQKALILGGDNYTDAEAALVKETISAVGLDADIVNINSDVDNRGWADAVDASTIDFSQYALVYFTWNGPGHDEAYFIKGAEDALKSWVENGGVVWMDAFDDNYTDEQGNQVGLWMPVDQYPVTIANTGDSDIEVTPEGTATGIFTTPNAVDLAALTLDDNFTNLAPQYVVLANRTDGNGAAAIQLAYGKGYYVGMCIDTRDAARLEAAKPMIENALFYLAKLVAMASAPVNPHHSLSTTLGSIKG